MASPRRTIATRSSVVPRKARARKSGGAAPFPAFIDPALPTLQTQPPIGDDWLHEIKFDGYRAQAHVRGEKVTIYTRRGYDWTRTFANIASELSGLKLKDAVIDGEVVVLDERGVSDFPKLQVDLAQSRTDRLVYFAFDLLYLDGRDLRGLRLEQRKTLLAQALKNASPTHVRLSEHLAAEGADVVAQACAMRLEGIVSKRRDAPYRSGRQDTWVKTKCTKSDTYPIVAFVEKLGAKPRRVASLYIGRRDGDRLLYAGKARSGYTDVIARELRERLDPFIRRTSPLSHPIKKPKATWVEPVVLAEVQYSSITADGLLREAVFKGLRDDLTSPEPTRVKPRTRRRTAPAVPKENILQWLPDAVVPSKEELIAYWHRIAPRALPYLAGRPLKLVRHVHGTTFYHMGPLPPIPAAVQQLKIRKRQGGEGTRLWVKDVEGLLGLVDIGAVELHPWNSIVDDIEHPDVLVFDLDPGEGIKWDFVVNSAVVLRDLLLEEGLESWPKITGGKGVHLMVPVESNMTHDEAHRYCRRVAQRLAKTQPDRYTLSATLNERRGRLFIDYLRNGRGTTAVGTFSPRARPGAPIAAPVTWRDIEGGIAADAYSITRLPGAKKRR